MHRSSMLFADSSLFVYLCLGSGCGTGSAKPGTEQEFERAFTRFPKNAAVSYLWPEGICTREAPFASNIFPISPIM